MPHRSLSLGGGATRLVTGIGSGLDGKVALRRYGGGRIASTGVEISPCCGYSVPMAWTVEVHRRVQRQIAALPVRVQRSLVTLLREIATTGPVRGNWPHYSRLGRTGHHCHLKRGHPTYVALWEVRDHRHQLVEVTYVGTHENAPY